MFRNILKRVSSMVHDLRQRFRKSSGKVATKLAPKTAPAKIASTNGHIKPRPKRKPPVRAAKKR